MVNQKTTALAMPEVHASSTTRLLRELCSSPHPPACSLPAALASAFFSSSAAAASAPCSSRGALKSKAKTSNGCVRGVCASLHA